MLDILEKGEIMDIEEINLQRLVGDNFDHYDVPATEEGDAVKITQTILQGEVAKVRTSLGDVMLEDLLGQPDDLPYVDIELPNELLDPQG